VITSFWPGILQSNTTENALDAEFYVTEIDRDDDDSIVWELKVHGKVSEACDASDDMDSCGRDLWGGWRAYSAERAFDAALVWDAACTVGEAGATLSFSAAGAIKQQNVAPAAFRATRPVRAFFASIVPAVSTSCAIV